MIIKGVKKTRHWSRGAVLAVDALGIMLFLLVVGAFCFFKPMFRVAVLPSAASEQLAESMIAGMYPGMEARCRYLERSCHPDIIEAIKGTFVAQAKKIVGFSELPHLNINLDPTALQTIKTKRADALSAGYLLSTDDDEVDGSIQYLDAEYPIDIRLKGLYVDHIDDPKKWSFRVHVDDGYAVLGMKRFSLQHPKVRNYQYESLYHIAAKRLGLIAPRYFFAKVSINGEKLGIMAVEEFFSDELAENNERRSGLFFHFSDEIHNQGGWNLVELQKNAPEGTVYRSQFCSGPFVNDISVYREKSVGKAPLLLRQRTAGRALLRSFISFHLPASEVFDVDKTGRFIAQAFAWNSFHNLSWVNLNFYFNPITYKFEPVPFDSNLSVVTPPAALHDSSVISPDGTRLMDTFGMDIIRLMLNDEKIYYTTREQLIRLNFLGSNEGVEAALKRDERPLLASLRQEYAFLPQASLAVWNHVGDAVSDFDQLEPLTGPPTGGGQADNAVSKKDFVLPNLPKYINSYITADTGGVSLEMINILNTDILVKDLHIKINGRERPLEEVVDISLPVLLTKSASCSQSDLQRYAIRGVMRDDLVEVTGTIQELTTDAKTEYSFASMPYAAAAKTHPLAPSNTNTLVAAHEFFVFDEKASSLTIKGGNWSISDFLILPEGVGLRVEAGTKLSFAPEAGLLVKGRIDILGTIDQPVVMKPLDEDKGWKGLTVLQANRHSEQRSVVQHTEIRGTTYAEYGPWKVTGGVTFYESDVKFSDTVIDGSQAEDALNIIRSKFAFDNLVIMNAVSDGFDGDFVNGVIQRSAFSHNRGDGIDFSGSRVVVRDSDFSEIGDKAVSVGEKSELDIAGIEVDTAKFGVVSKDLSEVRLRNAKLTNVSDYPLIAYQKKPEYGPAKLFAQTVTIDGKAAHEVACQADSELKLEGRGVRCQDIDIDELYATGE